MTQAGVVTRGNRPPRAISSVRAVAPPGAGDRHAAAGHDRRARGDLDRLQHHVRRDLPHAAQPLEPVGPERVDRDHGHRHGAHHRVAQHRPLGRVDARLHRLHDGDGPGRLDPEGARARLRPAVHLDHRARWSASRSARSSAASRASSSPTAGCRRSSSPWAGCWSGAASSSATRRDRPSPRSTRSSSCWAVARRAPSASSSAGWSGSSPAPGSSTRSGPAGADGDATTSPSARVGRGWSSAPSAASPSSGAVWVANSYSWPAAARRGTPAHGDRRPAGGLAFRPASPSR